MSDLTAVRRQVLNEPGPPPGQQLQSKSNGILPVVGAQSLLPSGNTAAGSSVTSNAHVDDEDDAVEDLHDGDDIDDVSLPPLPALISDIPRRRLPRALPANDPQRTVDHQG